MAHARGPYYFQINYHSPWAPHSHTINCGVWSNTASPGGHGQVLDHLGAGQDAKDQVETLVDAFLPFYPVDVTYDNWTIFHQPADPGPSFPMTGSGFTGKIGTDATAGWSKAAQATLTWKTVLFNDFKIVLLDFNSRNLWDKTTTLGSTRLADLDVAVTSINNVWQGRDNGQPLNFKSSAVKLNDELRRQYRMS